MRPNGRVSQVFDSAGKLSGRDSKRESNLRISSQIPTFCAPEETSQHFLTLHDLALNIPTLSHCV
ncbi:hypothetical protein E2C01_096703 [Portunus trituberculatus]|uniref:Uncharacterized protein n=1 Tax=Portunus trituberculatus TaxID=210409 RepID=A0A5B7K960_PORTR|nr:hypothetical protein [Portunus trituberculatus]